LNGSQIWNEKRLVEGCVHGVNGTVIVGDGFVLAGVVETDERPHQAAFFVDHRVAALLHFGDDSGIAGGELLAAGDPDVANAATANSFFNII